MLQHSRNYIRSFILMFLESVGFKNLMKQSKVLARQLYSNCDTIN